MKIILFLVCVLSAGMPVLVQRTGLSGKYGFKMKMLCAGMYLLTGALAAITFSAGSLYTFLILAALLCGVLGDFLLSYKNERYFLLGVIFFALGHVVYSIAFLAAGEHKAVAHIIPVAVFSVVMAFLLFLLAKAKLRLGKLQLPLLLYGTVLFFFFACAVTKGVMAISAGNLFFGLLLMAGAVLFIASDMMLGVQIGGVKLPKLLRHMVSYTYFPAQTLFALSIFFQTLING